MNNFFYKKIYLLFGLIILLFSSASLSYAAESKIVKVGAFDNYPVIFKDSDGVIKGFYPDLLADIGKKENIDFEYIFGTWNDGLDRIKSGEIDMLTSVAYTDERASYMDYCKNPILTVWGELYALPSSNIKGVLDVAGKNIGVLTGDINYKNFQTLVSQFNIEVRFSEFSTYDEVFNAVVNNKVDAGVVGVTFGMANEIKYGLESTGVVFNPLNLYFSVAKGKNQALLKILDSYILEWKQQNNSIYDQAEQKWLRGLPKELPVIPDWIVEILVALGVLVFILLIFIFLLNFRVRRVTKKIKEEEKRLEESEWKNKNIIENSKDMIFMIGADYKYLTVNKALADSIKKIPQDIIGKSMFDIFPEETYSAFLENLKKVFETGIGLSVEEKVMVENKYVFISSKLDPVKDVNGKVVAVAGIVRDISDSKKKEEELERMNRFMVARELRMKELKNKITKMEDGNSAEKNN